MILFSWTVQWFARYKRRATEVPRGLGVFEGVSERISERPHPLRDPLRASLHNVNVLSELQVLLPPIVLPLQILYGAKFYTPPPHPLKIPFWWWGAYKGGGVVAFPPQNIHPHHPPVKNAFWPEMGGGGGGSVYNFSLDPTKEGVWGKKNLGPKSFQYQNHPKISEQYGQARQRHMNF